MGAAGGFGPMQGSGAFMGQSRPGMQNGGRQSRGNAFMTGNSQSGRALNALGMGMPSSNVGSSNTQMSRNSFALNNNGVPVTGNIQPFSGIVPRQPSTVLSNSGSMNPSMGRGVNVNSNSISTNGAALNMNTNGMAANTGFNNGLSTNTAMNTANNALGTNSLTNSATSVLNTNSASNTNRPMNTNALNSGMSNGSSNIGSSSSIFANTASTNSGVSSFSSFSRKR